MPFGLLYSAAHSVTVAVEKEEKQTAGSAISLSHQSIINDGAFSAQPLGSGHDSRVGTTKKFHEDAAEATAGRAGEALAPRDPTHPAPVHPPGAASPEEHPPLRRTSSFAGPSPGSHRTGGERLLRGSWAALLGKSSLNPTESR